jgi:hypothetical protein
MLNSNAVYCSIIFANGTEGTHFPRLLYKNIKCENILNATDANLLPNAPHRHKTDRLTPDPSINATIASSAFLATRVATV